MGISAATIDSVKSLPVSSVLEVEGIAMKRVGREFVTRCIWHDDKNPSLTIADQKGFVFCHVCRASGDSINFIQQKFGLSFREAVERIARNHNIQTIYVDENSEELKQRRQQQQEEYEKAEEMQAYFRKSLKGNQKAISFLKYRKIAAQTSRDFGLGYNPKKNRITIPIHNASGKLVGFTSRAIGSEKPKYLNTENNVIFNKSDIVFNEYRALEHIREAGECIFVEGHFDVITLWQSGIKNVVALQGTASPEQSVINRVIKRTNRFVLCMDADEGGKKAIGTFLKATQDLSLAGKLDIRIASLPIGMDPDEALKEGVDFRSVIANSISWMDWILDIWLDTLDFQDSVNISKIENQIKDLFSKISSQSLRTHYFDKAALRLAQNKQSVAVQIAKSFHDSQKHISSVKSWSMPSFYQTRRNVEKRLIRLYLHKPSLRDVLRPLMPMLYYAEMKWLWQRIIEVENISSGIDLAWSIKAILAVAEPQYLQQLRPIAEPTIELDDSSGVLIHLEDTMLKQIPNDPDGSSQGTLDCRHQ